MNNPRGWSEEDIAQLTEMWTSGHTSPQIARKMKRTRSAIMGKVHRLGLSGKGGICLTSAHIDGDTTKIETKTTANNKPELVKTPAEEAIIQNRGQEEKEPALETSETVNDGRWARNGREIGREDLRSYAREIQNEVGQTLPHEDAQNNEIVAIITFAATYHTVDAQMLSDAFDVPLEITEKLRDDMIKAGLWTTTGPGDLQRYLANEQEGIMQLVLEAMLYTEQVQHKNGKWIGYTQDGQYV